MTQTTVERMSALISSKFTWQAAAHIAAEIDALISQRDEATAKAKQLTAELAEARAFISTIIDAPKDYPAEVSA